jgi:hypothetical protein
VNTTILPQAVYRRAREPRELPGTLRLRALEWAFYFAVSGKQTAAELGRQMRAETAESTEALSRLINLGLIAEQELDAAEYVRSLAAAGDREEKTLHEFLMGAAHPAPAPADTASSETLRIPRPRLLDVPDVTARFPRTTLRPGKTPQPALGFKPLPRPDDDRKENQRMSASRRLSLRALMNVIERQAPNTEAGQLDVYRVFVRVDTLLLKRNGIETLRFTEDRLVSDPELEDALVRSLKKTLGLDCPESVWVEVA